MYKEKCKISDCYNQAQGRYLSCNITLQLRGAVVDHCHKIGNVRGILCGVCNSVIGFIEKLNEPKIAIRRIEKYIGI
jgi:hypothetical protein